MDLYYLMGKRDRSFNSIHSVVIVVVGGDILLSLADSAVLPIECKCVYFVGFLCVCIKLFVAKQSPLNRNC